MKKDPNYVVTSTYVNKGMTNDDPVEVGASTKGPKASRGRKAKKDK